MKIALSKTFLLLDLIFFKYCWKMPVGAGLIKKVILSSTLNFTNLCI